MTITTTFAPVISLKTAKDLRLTSPQPQPGHPSPLLNRADTVVP